MLNPKRIWFALVLPLALLAACGEAEDRPSVIVIVLDTVRADHLSAWGYDRPTTPELDAFGDTATRFARAKATAPWTLPSHASMFTGLYPFEHTAHTVWYDPAQPDSSLVDNVRPLPDRDAGAKEVVGLVRQKPARIGLVHQVEYIDHQQVRVTATVRGEDDHGDRRPRPCRNGSLGK